MFATTDLRPHLAERGIDSPPPGLPARHPDPGRLNLTILAALCDILDCTPADLIEPHVVSGQGKARKVAGTIHPTGSGPTRLRPTRARTSPTSPAAALTTRGTNHDR